MPRRARRAPGGVVFHVLNRGVGRMRLFEDEGDYAAFERVVAEVQEDVAGVDLFAYCVMPNHWHLVVRPRAEGDLAAFMQRLTITHVRRWQEHRKLTGAGHVYQGRFKSFPVETDEHFLTLCRYVERNALRAGLVRRAEEWPWCSLWRRLHPSVKRDLPVLAEWPTGRHRNWTELVNGGMDAAELEAIRRSVERGRPYGGEAWAARTAKRLGLESSFRPRGRPRKAEEEG